MMPLRHTGRFFRRPGRSSLNMTPVIDIVFLLIIFFLVISRFIETESFSVTVPDGCEFAWDDGETDPHRTTLTVMKKPDGRAAFAVGGEEFAPENDVDLPSMADRLTELIDMRLTTHPPDSRTVTLRIDKDIPFSRTQYALAAVAQSAAANIRLAVMSTKLQPDNVTAGK
ncbi:MAG: biopolymer transporter ExbD [Sedimentisphaerales bacterium]|nr:biopolymer transporter ExbD [Sedimentisphaerales bacterium]